ncbi:RNA polymerase sigma factor SigJ [Microbacterium sp.]|uniref:RNA polymerase sigma factor SigJ n=1 Tax=Microbacterium sp. TaxID=51671 RepID=UPI003C74FC55
MTAVYAYGSSGYRRLFGVAYRILGSVHDAQDAVQEGIARWFALTEEQRERVREPDAWLTRVVARICLDELGSARARREHYTGIWLPEPLIGELAASAGAPERRDPADSVTLDERISIALLVAMEALTPGERVSLVLHDVFGLSFDEIAEVVGRSAASCRQLASTARRKVQARRKAQQVDPMDATDAAGTARDDVVAAFLNACVGGDLTSLVRLLDPGVVSRADGGDHVRAARKEVVGAETVARYLLGVVSTQTRRVTELVPRIEPVNGRLGIVTREGDRVVGVFDLEIVGGLITEIAILVNPEKLRDRIA